MEVRQGANARDVKGYDTERLRNDFLIQNLFPADDFKLVYSQIDRIIVGGCMPVNKELTLEAGSELKAAYFLERREMGIFNVGGNGSVIVDGTEYQKVDYMSAYKGVYRVLPSDAQIHIGIEGLASGEHTVTVKASGYKDCTFTLTVN